MTLPALEPLQIRSLTLRNRFVKTATYEGMTPGGEVTSRLVSFHAEMARQQIALTTVAYGAIASEGRTFADQLLIDDRSGDGLRRIADAVHAEEGAVSLQLAHCGGFSKLQAPLGPSRRLNLYGIVNGFPLVRAMRDADFSRTINAFAAAGVRARNAGFDAVELHVGHGYLLSQFLSPLTNRRRDEWGGDLAGRLRFPVAVVRALRDAVGADFPILAKTNLQDGLPGGLTLKESVAAARELVAAGIDALIPSGGMVQRNAFYLMRGETPLRQMADAEESVVQRVAMRLIGPKFVRGYTYQSAFFFEDACKLLDAVDVPVGLLGGVDSAAEVDRAMSAGFAFVVLGRALLADPDFIRRYASGERVVTRCNQCNLCVATMKQGVHCALDDK